MTRRREALDALTTSFQCSVPWESMREEGHRRFCDHCQRPVLDFADLTEREIHAQLQASRGKLCARLTKIDGRLVTRPPLQLPAPPSPPPRRASPLAAGLLSALLTAGTARAAATPEGAAQASTLLLEGSDAQPTDAPAAKLAFDDHIEVAADAYALEQTIEVGIIVSTAESLREQFEHSELVVLATVGRTALVEHTGNVGLVATELILDELYRGEGPGRSIQYLHFIDLEDAETPLDRHPDLPQGSVLAFLKGASAEHEALAGTAFEGASEWSSIKPLEGASLRAYRARLEALMRLEASTDTDGAEERLTAWQVGTAANRHTRAEAVSELPEDLARRHKRRLTAALIDTEGLRTMDMELYRRVRPWNSTAADAWLARQLEREPSWRATEEGAEPFASLDGVWDFENLAEEIESGALRTLAAAAEAEIDLLDESEDEEELARQDVIRELRRAFARVLAGGQ